MENNSKFEIPEIQALIYEDEAIASNQLCVALIFTSAREPQLHIDCGFLLFCALVFTSAEYKCLCIFVNFLKDNDDTFPKLTN